MADPRPHGHAGKPNLSPTTLCAQTAEAEARGALQLLDSFDAKSKNLPGVVPMPAGFIEQFAAKHESEGLDVAIAPISKCGGPTD